MFTHNINVFCRYTDNGEEFVQVYIVNDSNIDIYIRSVEQMIGLDCLEYSTRRIYRVERVEAVSNEEASTSGAATSNRGIL